MKTIVFYDPYHLDYAGAQKSMTILMNGLRKDNIDIILLTTKNSKINNEVNENIKRVLIPSFVTKFYNNRIIKIILESFFIFNIFLFKVFNKKKYIFIGNEELGVITLLPLRFLFKKVIWYIRSSDNLGNIDKILYNLSNHVITMNYALIDKKLTRYNIKKVSSIGSVFIKNISNKIDENIFNKIKNKKIIANIGAIVPRKNIIESIFVFEKLEIEDAYLLIIGPKMKEFEKYFEDVSKISSNNPKIIIIENYSSIDWLYPYIEILLLTSKDEGIPRVILEALYFNKKVIASDVGAIKNALKKYITREQLLIYNLGDISTLSFLLNKQIKNTTIYSSKEEISEEFGLENHIKNFIGVIKCVG